MHIIHVAFGCCQSVLDIQNAVMVLLLKLIYLILQTEISESVIDASHLVCSFQLTWSTLSQFYTFHLAASFLLTFVKA